MRVPAKYPVFRGPIFLLIAVLTACAPIPNEWYYAPKITGKVTRGSHPVPGAEVSLSSIYFDKTSSGRTDASGDFKVSALKELHLVAYLLGDPLYTYRLTIKADGNEYKGYVGGGVGYSPKKLEVVCDLEKPHELLDDLIFCSPSS